MELSQNALTPCILHLPLGRSGLCGVNFEALRVHDLQVDFANRQGDALIGLRLRAHARLAAWRRGSVVLVPLFAQLGGRDRSDSTVFGGEDVAVSVPPQQRAMAAASERRAVLVLYSCFGSAAEFVESPCLLDQCVDRRMPGRRINRVQMLAACPRTAVADATRPAGSRLMSQPGDLFVSSRR